ncbi:hypothetical protein niasHT_011354 [Heterodera trifolii]|uniref:Uncharacterized protein n=1 Tax=Heterodera trifolii TaxID=157864 RepID=A0ABD2LI78_9BILA
MEENDHKKRIIKRKLPQLPVTGVVLPFNSGVKPNMAKNGMARKALNPQAYEASAVKQMQSYKQTKSMELFKERGMKFTCVDSSQQQQEENRNGRAGGTSGGTLSSIATVSACPVDMMDPSDREAIQFYEGERNGGRETKGNLAKSTEGGGFGASSLERAKRFGLLPPKFDPRIPPPPICQPPKRKEIEQPKEKMAIKQETEVVVEISDDIPSFQCVNSVTPETNTCQISNSDSMYAENEENKKRFQLLWSLCQEELTIDAELEKTRKQLVEMRKNFDALAKAIKAKEKTEGMQEMRKKNIDERKKHLLTGTGIGEDQMKKAKRETDEATAE